MGRGGLLGDIRQRVVVCGPWSHFGRLFSLMQAQCVTLGHSLSWIRAVTLLRTASVTLPAGAVTLRGAVKCDVRSETDPVRVALCSGE